jgi:dTDP-glucose 4,6-dehydratase
MKVLITGAAGFIGHHLVDALLRGTDWHLTLIDRLDCSGNLNRLAEIGAAKNPRVRFVFHDLRAAINDQLAHQLGGFDYILHLAAATHVDRSIENPLEFVWDNVVGTVTMLDFARKVGCEKFLNFSTDEVYGPAPGATRYGEDDRYNCGNPYAATKAGAVQLGLAYHNTYGVPVLTTHTMNVLGIRQHPEKMVPGTVARVRDGALVTIHADKTRTKAGSRFYIDAGDVASAVVFLLEFGTAGEKYNVVGEREVDNLELASFIASVQGKPLHHEMVDFHSSRPGHDLRYGLSGAKLEAMGWKPKRDIFHCVEGIVAWSLYHPHWLTGPRWEVRSVA